MSEISASVINSLVGEAPFVKCPDVQALTEKTAVEMENATVQTISASVYQVGKGKRVVLLRKVLFGRIKHLPTASELGSHRNSPERKAVQNWTDGQLSISFCMQLVWRGKFHLFLQRFQCF